MKIAKCIGSVAVAAAMALSFTACEEDIVNETNEPLIYQQIKLLYDQIEEQTTCEGITKGILGYQRAQAEPFAESMLDMACQSYAKTKSNNPNADIAVALTNSGYYMATYIMISRWMKKSSTCEKKDDLFTPVSTNNTLKFVLSQGGCQTLVNDAIKAVSDYPAQVVDYDI